MRSRAPGPGPEAQGTGAGVPGVLQLHVVQIPAATCEARARTPTTSHSPSPSPWWPMQWRSTMQWPNSPRRGGSQLLDGVGDVTHLPPVRPPVVPRRRKQRQAERRVHQQQPRTGGAEQHAPADRGERDGGHQPQELPLADVDEGRHGGPGSPARGRQGGAEGPRAREAPGQQRHDRAHDHESASGAARPAGTSAHSDARHRPWSQTSPATEDADRYVGATLVMPAGPRHWEQWVSHDASTVTWWGHASVEIRLDGARLVTDPLLRNRVGPLHSKAYRPSRRDVEALASVDGCCCRICTTTTPTCRPSVASVRRPRPLSPWGAAATAARPRAVLELAVGAEARLGGRGHRGQPALHDGNRHRHRAEAVGYLVRGSHTVYFAGDTEEFPEMASWPRCRAGWTWRSSPCPAGA